MPLCLRIALPLLLAAALGCAPVHAAEMIYNNFSDDPDSPLNPYADPAFGYQISWTSATHWTDDIIATQGAAYAMPFVNTLTQEASLRSVSLALYKVGDNEVYDSFGDALPTNHDNVSILLAGSDAAGTGPGDILEALAVNPLIAPDTTSFLTLDSSARSVLKPGETYWILVQPTDFSLTSADADTFYFWVQSKADLSYDDYLNLYNPFSELGGWTGYLSQGDGPQLAPSLMVSVDAVPEPATIGVLFLGGLAAWVGSKRRGEQATRGLRGQGGNAPSQM